MEGSGDYIARRNRLQRDRGFSYAPRKMLLPNFSSAGKKHHRAELAGELLYCPLLGKTFYSDAGATKSIVLHRETLQFVRETLQFVRLLHNCFFLKVLIIRAIIIVAQILPGIKQAYVIH